VVVLEVLVGVVGAIGALGEIVQHGLVLKQLVLQWWLLESLLMLEWLAVL
jgi:hypothetical protein